MLGIEPGTTSTIDRQLECLEVPWNVDWIYIIKLQLRFKVPFKHTEITFKANFILLSSEYMRK